MGGGWVVWVGSRKSSEDDRELCLEADPPPGPQAMTSTASLPYDNDTLALGLTDRHRS